MKNVRLVTEDAQLATRVERALSGQDIHVEVTHSMRPMITEQPSINVMSCPASLALPVIGLVHRRKA